MKLQEILLLCLVIDLALTAQLAASVSNHLCPIWTIPQIRNGGVECECGNSNLVLDGVVKCNQNLKVSIAVYHCITYSEVFDKLVLGFCEYNFLLNGYYWHVPRLENMTLYRDNTVLCNFTDSCHQLFLHGGCTSYEHQTGLTCTSCVDGYAYPVYSYSVGCVECKDYKYNWLKYIAVAFLPLTVFYIIVVLFRIPATSGLMNGYILMCQLLTTPWNVRAFSRYGSQKVTGFYFSIIAIWNLDFFRGLYTPFCLHPKLTTLQTLMLDYVIAVYPLLLVIVTYFCVKLHNRFSIVVKLWNPFYKCFALVRNKWDINRSLVEAFATFILLSYVKIVNVSFYALTPNTFYDVRGNKMPKTFLYYDGTYEFFGADHLPYAILALFMLLVFNIFPLVLLCLYPFHYFHKCLNYCRLRFLALHIFMDAFHGCYKLQPRDCRLFAALSLFLRVLNNTLLAVNVGEVYLAAVSIAFVLMVILLAAFRPHKSAMHTLTDTIFFCYLSVVFLGIPAYQFVYFVEKSYLHLFVWIIVTPLVSLPPLYGIGLLVYLLLPKKVLVKAKAFFQRCKHFITKQTDSAETEYRLPYRFYHSEEYPPLLP